MRELRQVQKAIKEYEDLLSTDIEEAKKNCGEYMKDLYLLREFIQCYINSTADEFSKWADISVNNFLLDGDSILFKIKKEIDRLIINHYLSKLSFELAQAGKCDEGLEKINTRFEQFKYLT